MSYSALVNIDIDVGFGWELVSASRQGCVVHVQGVRRLNTRSAPISVSENAHEEFLDRGHYGRGTKYKVIN